MDMIIPFLKLEVVLESNPLKIHNASREIGRIPTHWCAPYQGASFSRRVLVPG